MFGSQKGQRPLGFADYLNGGIDIRHWAWAEPNLQAMPNGLEPETSFDESGDDPAERSLADFRKRMAQLGRTVTIK
jgi:hypothetical protein